MDAKLPLFIVLMLLSVAIVSAVANYADTDIIYNPYTNQDDFLLNKSMVDDTYVNITGDTMTGNLLMEANITHSSNTTFGIYNNGTCMVIGDLSYVSEC